MCIKLIEEQVENTIQLIINENGEIITNYNSINEINTSNITLKEELIETDLTTTNIFEDSTVNPDELDLFETKTPNNCFEEVKIIYNDKEYAGLMYVQNEEKEKKIMRIKRKKKTQKNTIIPHETKKTKLNTPETNNPNIETNKCPDSNEETEKSQVSPIFLCATCSDQFSSVEECKTHYIEVHKYEDKSKEVTKIVDEKVEDSVESNAPDKKEILEKFFKQDVLKKRKHKYI